MNRFLIPLELSRDPRCPYCVTYLHPTTVKFRRDLALCPTCFDTRSDAEISELVRLVCHPKMAHHYVTDRGLHFYAPHVSSYGRVSAYVHAQELGLAPRIGAHDDFEPSPH